MNGNIEQNKNNDLKPNSVSLVTPINKINNKNPFMEVTRIYIILVSHTLFKSEQHTKSNFV